ncbi:YkvA family protein [Xanthobacter sp. TB0139]|uniref:YkvA family protein n=1 Tax=Xanthobacter sp. TB0139 TaxID=3459178 RepID=UPI004039494B
MANMNSASMNALEWKNLDEKEGAKAASDEARVRKGFWKKLGRSASQVPFAEDAVAAYYAAFDKTTPLKVRATLLASLAYFVLPVDAVPDVLPVLGYGDDAALLMGTLRLLCEHVKPQHQSAAHDILEGLQQD